MTDTETKALKLLNDCGGDALVVVRNKNPWVEALCRAIEQHEAFQQEVSDVVWDYYGGKHIPRTSMFAKFAIPKPDPLVKALTEINGEGGFDNFDHYAHNLRAALDAAGFEIKEKSK